MSKKRQNSYFIGHRAASVESLIGLDAFVNETDLEALLANAKTLFDVDFDYFDLSNVKARKNETEEEDGASVLQEDDDNEENAAEVAKQSTVDQKVKQKGTTLQRLQKLRRRLAIAGVLMILPLTFFFSSFSVIIPFIHGVGGYVLHKQEGWAFYQPGKGGVRFVAQNGIAWTFYALTLLLQLAHLLLGDILLAFTAFISGLLSLSFMFSSLFAFKGTQKYNGMSSMNIRYVKTMKSKKERQLKESKRQLTDVNVVGEDVRQTAPEFNSRLQRSVLMHSGERPSVLWWVFISMQVLLCSVASWFLILIANHSSKDEGYSPLRLVSVLVSTVCFAGAIPVTHAIGGKWKNIKSSFTAYQPFNGGRVFVALQGTGWFLYSLTLFSCLVGVFSRKPSSSLLLFISFAGLVSELLIFASLFHFQGKNSNRPGQAEMSGMTEWLIQRLVEGANMLFGPGNDWRSMTRRTILTDTEDWKLGERRFQELLKNTGADQATGEQYLVVGCGFVGKRLVKRLLERGETRIRVFDLNPRNPFEDVTEVEYIVGDVTKLASISAACRAVDVIYATFALIRFMDRLPHQAALSYHVNVRGTEVLFDALKQEAGAGLSAREGKPLKVVVTSSSHATTDETSLPRYNRTEEAPYVTRKTAHNHYGWTKALADQYALSQNDSVNGALKVIIVRPCSGVFGGDDRTSLERMLDMGFAPGIGAYYEMDWVYVENVVLGHILAEQGLREDIKNGQNTVAGEAFNISNNEGTRMIDFWFLVKDILKLQMSAVERKKQRKVRSFEFVFVPMSLIWTVAYISEGVQRLFKGKVRLGVDIDSLTPAMLSTVLMTYTYDSDKARKLLSYEPAFTMEQGIQKSVDEYYTIKVLKRSLY